MDFRGELREKENRRNGPGWWMDASGTWRPPHEWPEDTPPLPTWVRDEHGVWGPSDARRRTVASATRWSRGEDANESPTESTRVVEERPRSRQAKADIKAMLLVSGAIGTALLLLVGALILINQAGAADEKSELKGASFTLDSIADRRAAQEAATDARGPEAVDALAQLKTIDREAALAFASTSWPEAPAACADPRRLAIEKRTLVPIEWADRAVCEPSSGRWRDRYVDTFTTDPSMIDALNLIPLAIIDASGAWQWDESTRSSFVSDDFPPATTLVTANSGHNPRAQGPEAWRPAREATWCAYAVDWVEVKARWTLGVTDAERVALNEMLSTCAESSSDGPDVDTVELRRRQPPTISIR